MKILIASDYYIPVVNGVVISACHLIRGLEELGHEVRVLTLSATARSHIDGDVYYVGSLPAGWIYPKARIKISGVRRIVNAIAEWSPDVIHTQCEFSTFAVARKAAKKSGATLIHTYHTLYEDYTHYFCPSKKVGKSIVSFLSRKFLNKTDAVITPTDKVRRILSTYGIKVPVSTVPTGLDLCKFSRGDRGDETREIREKLSIPENASVVVSIGRLAKEKNFDELLTYFKKADTADAVFVVVGDGPYRKKLEDITDESGLRDKVIFTGMIPPEQVGAYYRMGDVFVSASQSETQGLTYVEAMASGLPVLCRKDPCLDGLVEDGVNGFQYETEEEFVRKLHVLLGDRELREKLGNAAAETARERYSIPGFARSVAEIYVSAPKRDKK